MIPTGHQTVGPFFHLGLVREGDQDVVAPGAEGAIRLEGRVFDGGDEPIPDALIEIWSDAGFGRCTTDVDGRYAFTTLEPDAFFAVKVFARGLMAALDTRIYVPGASDSLLQRLGDRRKTLIATRTEPAVLTHDIRLQGDGETVFLAWR